LVSGAGPGTTATLGAWDGEGISLAVFAAIWGSTGRARPADEQQIAQHVQARGAPLDHGDVLSTDTPQLVRAAAPKLTWEPVKGPAGCSIVDRIEHVGDDGHELVTAGQIAASQVARIVRRSHRPAGHSCC